MALFGCLGHAVLFLASYPLRVCVCAWQLSSLNVERDGLLVEVSETNSARTELQENLEQSNTQHQQQVLDLLQQLEDKNRAGENL